MLSNPCCKQPVGNNEKKLSIFEAVKEAEKMTTNNEEDVKDNNEVKKDDGNVDKVMESEVYFYF